MFHTENSILTLTYLHLNFAASYLKLFDKLLTYGERLGVLQKTFNQDTNGAGPSIVYAVQQQSNYENIFKKNTSKVFLNEDSIANNTEQGYLFEQLMDTAINTASEIFPIEAMYNGIEQVLAQTGKELADVPLDTQKTIYGQVHKMLKSIEQKVITDQALSDAEKNFIARTDFEIYKLNK